MVDNFWGAIIRLVIALPLVSLLAYFLIKYGLSKKYLQLGDKYIKVIEQTSINPKASLNVVKIGEKYFLLTATEQQVNVLQEINDYQEKERPENEYLKVLAKKFSRESEQNE
ncbi:flagellar protein FliO/FliZ [Desulfonispora thiosulfatigenes DSM 11270]|uniref:Flagellar protein n=1 Tax=Desulfonispora thiosulfatigenes DSM 11270 TaxID=656914 RepID=A0A1W1UML9_DESTI|nr:flagellar biosynthetic protein FliO [Desulfonispora thiosulfatigenes]SMB82385.1 flagellar protein FliO/FliZ [Desulfonispora thiosulfatigenes DSM 11270]